MNPEYTYARLGQIYEAFRNCTACGLHKFRQQIVFGQGVVNPKVVVLGEGPWKEEDRLGVPFIGPSGTRLFEILAEACPREDVVEAMKAYRTAHKTLHANNDTAQRRPLMTRVEEAKQHVRALLLQDIYLLNAVMCPPTKVDPEGKKPPEPRDPDVDEMKACRGRLMEQLYLLDPAIIIAAGGTAVRALTGRPTGITRTRGQLMDINIPGRYGPVHYLVMPIFHPSYLLKVDQQCEEGGKTQQTYKDIARALSIAYAVESRSRHIEHLRYDGEKDTWS